MKLRPAQKKFFESDKKMIDLKKLLGYPQGSKTYPTAYILVQEILKHDNIQNKSQRQGDSSTCASTENKS